MTTTIIIIKTRNKPESGSHKSSQGYSDKIKKVTLPQWSRSKRLCWQSSADPSCKATAHNRHRYVAELGNAIVRVYGPCNMFHVPYRGRENDGNNQRSTPSSCTLLRTSLFKGGRERMHDAAFTKLGPVNQSQSNTAPRRSPRTIAYT